MNSIKKQRFFVLFLSGLFIFVFSVSYNIKNIRTQNQASISSPKLFQLQMYVTDINKAAEFYGKHFGFEIMSKDYLPDTLPMRFGDVRIVFHKVSKPARIDYPEEAQTFFVIKTGNLRPFIKKLKADGVELIHTEPQKAAVGIYAAFRDPFGIVHEMLEESPDNGVDSVLELYAVQVNVENMDNSVNFYCNTLGLEKITNDYYPRVVPLKLQNIMIVLHKAGKGTQIDYPNTAQALVNIEVDNIAETIKRLKDDKYEVIYDPPHKFPLGLYAAIKDPSGNIHALVEVRNSRQ